MSENIKDVLDSIKEAINKNDDSIDSFLIATECWKELLDYIANLQKRLDFMIDRNDEKQERINKAIEYIEEKYDYILKDATFLDHDELVDRKHMLKLIEILKGEE